MTKEDMQFLLYVQNYCANKPEIAARISDYAAAGIRQRLEESRGREGNLEAALLAAVAGRFKGAEGVILDRIKELSATGKCHFKWDSVIEGLEAKLNKADKVKE